MNKRGIGTSNDVPQCGNGLKEEFHEDSNKAPVLTKLNKANVKFCYLNLNVFKAFLQKKWAQTTAKETIFHHYLFELM